MSDFVHHLTRFISEVQDPEFALHHSRELADILNADSATIWLSRETANKIQGKHHRVTIEIFERLPEIIGGGTLSLDPLGAACCFHCFGANPPKPYKAVVKVTEKRELYLSTLLRFGHKKAQRELRKFEVIRLGSIKP